MGVHYATIKISIFRECLALSNVIVKHCYLAAGHTELHFGDERPLSDIPYHCTEEAGL